MEVPNSELDIGTATRLLLEEEADSMEGTQQEAAFFTKVRAFYREAVSKMVSKFPFRDTTIRDLSLLDPSSRSKTTSAAWQSVFSGYLLKTWTTYTVSSLTTSRCQRTSCFRSMPAVLLRLTTSGKQSPACQCPATQSSTDSHTWQNCAKCSSSYLTPRLIRSDCLA